MFIDYEEDVMKSLALFFTFNIGLDTWVKSGLLDREKLIYEKYIKEKLFHKIYWFTYGINDQKYKDRLIDGIEIISMSRIFNFKMGRLLYSFLMPFLYGNIFKQVDILKTNQMSGSWSAVLCKIFYHKPLIVRTGWTWSIFKEKEIKNRISLNYFIISLIEKIAYKFCNVAEVTSDFQIKYLIKKYKIKKEKFYLIPNYIDLNIFKNKIEFKVRKKEFVFVGRLEPQKNLDNLIRAVALVNIKLDIYGDGSLIDNLKRLAIELNTNVLFKGIVLNKELPGIYNQYKYFILSSFYEGTPKVLLEAMACGLICIGTDVDGINEILEDGINGFLAKGTSYQEIADTIKKALLTNNKKIIKKCREKIKQNFSLQYIFEIEKNLFNKLQNEK